MAVATKDYYQILGVSKTATDDDIRKKYRSLARKHHPDLNPGDKSAEDRFKEINEAYGVLSDADKRKQYDHPAPPPRTNGSGGFHQSNYADGEGQEPDFSDFFASAFGGRGRATFRMAGQDVNATITLTLEDAHHGVVRSINLSGGGAKVKSLDVTIPRGVRDGSVIRLAGQGEPGSEGAAPGDLYLHVEIEPHPTFQLLGDDLQVDLPVTPWEAMLGAKVNVPTLDKQVEMTIPAGSQAGQRLRLRKQGLHKRDGGRGDEYVKLKIVVPPSPTVREKELFGQLATVSQYNPRAVSNGS